MCAAKRVQLAAIHFNLYCDHAWEENVHGSEQEVRQEMEQMCYQSLLLLIVYF